MLTLICLFIIIIIIIIICCCSCYLRTPTLEPLLKQTQEKGITFITDILSLNYCKCLCLEALKKVFIQHLYTASIHETFTLAQEQKAEQPPTNSLQTSSDFMREKKIYTVAD